jgi:S13-like protein
MPGPAGADDPALEQARLAQLAPRAYADAWLCRYTAGTGAPRPAPPAPAVQGVTRPVMQLAAQEEGGAKAGAVRMRAGASGTAAADGAVQIAEAERGARPKPVPPPRSGEQRKAALDAARQRNAELKALRAGLQARQLTLAELLALAQSDHAAGRMPVRTALMALPGIRTARASQLMIQAGISDGCRAGALSARQREQLVGAVGTVRLQSPGRRR